MFCTKPYFVRFYIWNRTFFILNYFDYHKLYNFFIQEYGKDLATLLNLILWLITYRFFFPNLKSYKTISLNKIPLFFIQYHIFMTLISSPIILLLFLLFCCFIVIFLIRWVINYCNQTDPVYIVKWIIALHSGKWKTELLLPNHFFEIGGYFFVPIALFVLD